MAVVSSGTGSPSSGTSAALDRSLPADAARGTRLCPRAAGMAQSACAAAGAGVGVGTGVGVGAGAGARAGVAVGQVGQVRQGGRCWNRGRCRHRGRYGHQGRCRGRCGTHQGAGAVGSLSGQGKNGGPKRVAQGDTMWAEGMVLKSYS